MSAKKQSIGLDTDEIRRVYNPARYEAEDAIGVGLAVLDTVAALCNELDVARSTLALVNRLRSVPDHAFRPVSGHPDDDECTNRSDGTDATYCGLPLAEHPSEVSA